MDGTCAEEYDLTDLVHCGIVDSKEMEQKISTFLTNSVIGKEETTCYCVNPKCSCPFTVPNDRRSPKVVCVACGTAMCRNCRCEWHDGVSCQRYQEWKKQNDKSDELFEDFKRKNTRPCPHCHVDIFKDGGCQWMMCRHCNGFFCWRCMQKSNDHAHFPGTDCVEWKGNQ